MSTSAWSRGKSVKNVLQVWFSSDRSLCLSFTAVIRSIDTLHTVWFFSDRSLCFRIHNCMCEFHTLRSKILTLYYAECLMRVKPWVWKRCHITFFSIEIWSQKKSTLPWIFFNRNMTLKKIDPSSENFFRGFPPHILRGWIRPCLAHIYYLISTYNPLWWFLSFLGCKY